MAGRGPAPKPPDQRRRRNKPTAGEWRLLPAETYSGPVPPLPRIKGGLQEATKKTWASWWLSPVAHMWTEADWPLVQNAIALQERFNRSLTSGSSIPTSLLTQQRLILDSLGLTPKGRQDRRWMLPADSDDQADDVDPDVPDELEPRRRLKAVDPDLVDKPKRKRKAGEK